MYIYYVCYVLYGNSVQKHINLITELSSMHYYTYNINCFLHPVPHSNK